MNTDGLYIIAEVGLCAIGVVASYMGESQPFKEKTEEDKRLAKIGKNALCISFPGMVTSFTATLINAFCKNQSRFYPYKEYSPIPIYQAGLIGNVLGYGLTQNSKIFDILG